MNRKIFIDCGFYCGGAIMSFKRTPEYSSDFIYYAFDPMLNLEKAKQRWPNITLDNRAIWINDGQITFYTSKRLSGRANSVYHNKRAKKENEISIPCIDFSNWIKNNFDMNDYIILKMDIEGAEYEVVPKMIKDSTIDYIDVIYLEWHGNRTGDTGENIKKEVMDSLKNKKRLIVRRSLERYLQRDLKKEKV